MIALLIIGAMAAVLCVVCCVIQASKFDALSLAGCLLFGAVALLAFVFAAVYAYEDASCGDRADAMDRGSRYGFTSGCLVRTDDGRLVPLDNLRFNEQGEAVR